MISLPKKDHVVIGAYADLNLAKLHISVLADRGIPAYLKDEFVNSIMPFYTYATGGAKLMVLKEDVDRAVAVLGEGGDSNDEESVQDLEQSDYTEDDSGPVPGTPTRVPTECPDCRSDRIAFVPPFLMVTRFVYLALFIVLLRAFGLAGAILLVLVAYVGARLLGPSGTWECKECGWKMSRAEPEYDEYDDRD